MNTPTPMDDAARLRQEMKESARRDAARALEGFEKRAQRIEEGKPARTQFKGPEPVFSAAQKSDEKASNNTTEPKQCLQGANFETEVAVTIAWPQNLAGRQFLVVPFDDASTVSLPTPRQRRAGVMADSWDCWRSVAARVGSYLEGQKLVRLAGEGLPDLVVFVGYDSSNDQFSDSAQFGIMPDLRRICSFDSGARIENAREDIRASCIIAVAAMDWQNANGRLVWRTKAWGGWFGKYDRDDELVQALALIDTAFEDFPRVDPRVKEDRSLKRQWRITAQYPTGSPNGDWYRDISYDTGVARVREKLAAVGLYHENSEPVRVHLTRAAPKPVAIAVRTPVESRPVATSVYREKNTASNTDTMDFLKDMPKPDAETVIMERVDAWNGMTNEVIYNKAYNHKDRAAVGMVIEGLREEALGDNPKISGAVWWIIFGTVVIGSVPFLLGGWALLLLVLLCWGAQAWICRLAKRGRAPVPPHLVAYLMANAQELKRALDVGDAKGIALHAQIEHDTQREIYRYMRGLKK